jgi:hypothetical protein
MTLTAIAGFQDRCDLSVLVGCPIRWNPIFRSAHASCSGVNESQ